MATKKKAPREEGLREASRRRPGRPGRASGPRSLRSARRQAGPGRKAARATAARKPGWSGKLPRKYGPRRKAPASIGREAAPPVAAADANLPDDGAAPRARWRSPAGLDKKAEEIRVFDVRGLSSYADYFVIMTADSDRQAGAIADHVDDRLKEAGHSQDRRSRGTRRGNWIIVDYGDVVTHVMSPRPARLLRPRGALGRRAPGRGQGLIRSRVS